MPQSPNFPVSNASAHEAVLQKVTEMFKLNFPYTTVYPALGNLDVLHPRILEASESSSAVFGKTREADHYRGQSYKKRRKWYGREREHHETSTAACKLQKSFGTTNHYTSCSSTKKAMLLGFSAKRLAYLA